MAISSSVVSAFIRPNRHEPMLNSLMLPILSTTRLYTTNLGRKKNQMNWYKLVPELTAIVDMVAESVAGKYHFEVIDGSGRNKLKAARAFSKHVNLPSLLFSQAVDNLVCGEAFGWLSLASDKDISKLSKNLVDLNSGELNSEKMKSDAYNKLFFEIKANIVPGKYKYVASSTMNVLNDGYDTIAYSQIVRGVVTDFKPENIIHFKNMDIDGKPEGFTPFSACLTPAKLLYMMWTNQQALQENGGHADKIYTLKNTSVNSPAYKAMKDQIESQRIIENRHGNLLFTGEVDVIDLMDKDAMLFKEVGLYVTGALAMQWNVPRTFLPHIVSGTNTQNDTGGASERMYWKRIEKMQDRFADVYNTELFNKFFGVDLVFDKEYKQDEAAENTAKQLGLTNIEFMQRILGNYQFKLNPETLFNLMGLEEGDLEKMSAEEVLQASGLARQGMLPQNNDKPKGTDDQIISSRKMNEQVSLSKQAGKSVGV